MLALVTILSYITSVLVIAAYAALASRGPGERDQRAFRLHLANAVGFVPTVLVEVAAHAYPPIILTASFGIIGVVGLIQGVGSK